MTNNSIIQRYTALAATNENLSCGTPILFADVQPEAVCVDLGCGTGKDCMVLSERVGKSGKVIGIDITPSMIEKAKKITYEKQIENIEFVLSSFEHLPLSDESVDYVFSGCAINHSENKLKVFQEIYRILKPSGKAIISDIYSMESIKSEFKNNPEKVAECWAGAVTKEEYINIILAAGFKDILINRETEAYKKYEAIIKSFTFTITKPLFNN